MSKIKDAWYYIHYKIVYWEVSDAYGLLFE